MKNFWSRLPKPIYALAPMAGVTDSAFRQICKDFGADVVYSEMVSATALAYNSKKTLVLMKFNEKERPYVVQLFGGKPDHFAKAVKIVEKKIKPDGIDINFGCPVKKVQKQGAGAILMNDLKLSKAIIKAAINNTKLPVSIKCRTRTGEINVLKFLDYVAGLDIKAVMIHGRTLAQGQCGDVDWQIIKQARSRFGGIILANGGVKNAEAARDLLEKTRADGIGIGQGAMGKPWIFKQFSIFNFQFSIKEIFEVALKHAELMEKLKGRQGIIEMRKHLCWYVSGLPNASILRDKLVKVESLGDLKNILT